MAVFGRPPTGRSERFLPGDVVVRPHHAEPLQLRDAVVVHVPAGVEPASVGDPLPQWEPRQGGGPLFGFRLLVVLGGHAVRERHA